MFDSILGTVMFDGKLLLPAVLLLVVVLPLVGETMELLNNFGY